MLYDSFAPIKRASLFFGVMGAAIAALTFAADFQQPGDQSSATIAKAKIDRNEPRDTRFAAIDPAQRQISVVRRAIPSSQQAKLELDSSSLLR